MADPMKHGTPVLSGSIAVPRMWQDDRVAASPVVERDAFQPRPVKPNRFRLIPLSEIEVDDQQEWLIKGLLPASGLAFVYGRSGSYKSTVTLDVAFAVASGHDWGGRKVLGGAVVYIAAEGGSGMKKRMLGLAEFRGQKEAPIVLCPVAPNLGSGSADREALIDAVEQHQRSSTPLRLIVIDTLSRTLFGADENGSGMQAVITNAKELAEHFSCLVLVVHHTGHDQKGRMRGHSSAQSDADAVWKVSRNPKAKLAATIVVEKQKDGEDGHRLALRLSQHCLHGSDSTVLVVSDANEGGAYESTELAFTGRQGQAYGAFRDCTAGLEAGSSIDLAALNEAFNAKSSESPASNRDAMKNVLNKLERSGVISRAPAGRTTTITILRRLE